MTTQRFDDKATGRHLNAMLYCYRSSDCVRRQASTSCTGSKVGGGGGDVEAGVLAQAVTHASQTSLVTSQPARQNYKTGRAGAGSRQQAAWRRGRQRSGGRAAGRPRRATGDSHTVGGVSTPGGGANRGAGAGAGIRARGERRYGARAQVL